MDLQDYLRLAPQHGLVLEFGVAEGGSLKRIAEAAGHRIVYGFDWFEGLPEDWRAEDGDLHQAAGAYRTSVPQVPENAVLVIGLFQRTLARFLGEHLGPVAFVHIDCDLYSSAFYVLSMLRDRLSDTVIAFDEFDGVPAYDFHEKRAFEDFLRANPELVAEPLPRREGVPQAAFCIRRA